MDFNLQHSRNPKLEKPIIDPLPFQCTPSSSPLPSQCSPSFSQYTTSTEVSEELKIQGKHNNNDRNKKTRKKRARIEIESNDDLKNIVQRVKDKNDKISTNLPSVGDKKFATLPSENEDLTDSSSSIFNNVDDFNDKFVHKPRKRLPIKLKTLRKKNKKYETMIEKKGIEKKFKNLNLQTENIVSTKRRQLETNRFLPTKRQFGRIKALQIRPEKPPITEQMSNKWKKFHTKYDTVGYQTSRYENLLKNNDIDIIDKEDDRIKLKMAPVDDKIQFDNNLPKIQRYLNVGTSTKKLSLLSPSKVDQITKKFDNSEKKEAFKKNHQANIELSIKENNLYRCHGVVGMCVRDNSY